MQSFQDYYPHLFSKILAVNGPRILGILSKAPRWFLGEQHANSVQFMKHPQDVLRHASAANVPKAYGGQLVDHSGFADPPESCMCRMELIQPADHYVADTIWAGREKPAVRSHHIHRGHTLTLFVRTTQRARVIRWSYWLNGSAEFSVRRVTTNSHDIEHLDEDATTRAGRAPLGPLVYPTLPSVTAKVPDECLLVGDESQLYAVEVHNANLLFALKLDIAIAACDD